MSPNSLLKTQQGSQMALVVTVPIELACLCAPIAAVIWQKGPVGSEKWPRGAHAKCVGVGVKLPSSQKVISKRTLPSFPPWSMLFVLV